MDAIRRGTSDQTSFPTTVVALVVGCNAPPPVLKNFRTFHRTIPDAERIKRPCPCRRAFMVSPECRTALAPGALSILSSHSLLTPVATATTPADQLSSHATVSPKHCPDLTCKYLTQNRTLINLRKSKGGRDCPVSQHACTLAPLLSSGWSDRFGPLVG